MPLGADVGLDPGDIVSYGDSAAPMERGTATPHISAHVYCSQTAGWIMIPLGTEVGLGPGDIVLDGDPAPPRKGAPPLFVPCLLWPNRCPSQPLLNSCLLCHIYVCFYLQS